MHETALVVPARLGSQRFPGKLLHPVRGRPLILWTAENLSRIASGMPLYFAVAEAELAEVLGEKGYTCIRTDPGLASGTDRIAIANREIGARRVINVQADEPVLSAGHLSQLMQLMDGGMDAATLATPFARIEDFQDPNKVKVVVSPKGEALYFSRSPIPYDRDRRGGLPPDAWWHMGVYAYTDALLEAFLTWSPGRLEGIERLEQLRIMENGQRIGVGLSEKRTVGVDVVDDLDQLEAFLKERED
ncbi:MAG TPA: 3-deoxy-manno-octulosonate cytidylyltransferase [Oceanipulchritudo sp.]|nr:3-deoxy-manno-octulosonate cytidylyltransferase [Oceanipulchritudo sp.]